MQLVPTQQEVIDLLRQTGALRHGHFVYPNGMHSNDYLQVALAMRYYQHAKTLSVALSRLLRANPEIRAALPELSIVAPATGGLPVAYGIGEALRANQIYWAEKEGEENKLQFRQFLEQKPGEKVVLVDDILRSGKKLRELKTLVESNGAEVMAIAVVVYQPTPGAYDFEPTPLYYLAKMNAAYYPNAEACDLATHGMPPETIRV
jgi:orotate phosphoribosyltransferase